ncbi:MAG: hypothetical protein AB8B94_00485 [Hyphomicrobiales bacterium]
MTNSGRRQLILPRKFAQRLLICVCVSIAGCTKIPDSDIVFLDGEIPLGMQSTQAREIIKRRGFAQTNIKTTSPSRYDVTSQSYKQLPISLTDTVKQNIGFVELIGEPSGQITCFARGYARLVASGDRLICWTEDEDQKITWRQAGWIGAML